MANYNVTALTLAAATSSTNGPDLDNLSSRAAHIVIDITAITGTTPTATFTVQGKDEASGKYYPLLVSAALSAIGTTVLRIGQGQTASANLVAVDAMPRTFRVIAAIAGTTPSVTATVGVALIN